MAIRRVAQKLYAQQGEFGTVRKAYKEAFRRQMIANYSPANIIGRMFGFGSMFHTMAKRAFGTPEWNPRSLETGRPDYAPGAKPYVKGGAGVMPSRASDIILSDIADNTERTADALEKIGSVASDAQKKVDLEENTQKEREFEENLKNIKAIGNVRVGGPASALGQPDASTSQSSGIGPLIALLGIGAVSLVSYLNKEIGDSIQKVKDGFNMTLGSKDWWYNTFIAPIGNMVKDSISIVETLWEQFKQSDLAKFLGRPWQPTGRAADILQRGQENERFNSQAKHRGRRSVGKSKIENGEPVLRMPLSTIAPPPPNPPTFFHGGLSNLGAMNSAQTSSIGGLDRKNIPAGIKVGATTIVQGLMKRGFTQDESIAIAANMQQESAFKTNAVGDNGHAWGLMQWNGPRQRDLAEFAAAQGKSWTDLETQLDFTAHELRGKEAGAFKEAMKGKTIAEKTKGFSEKVERPGIPHMARRLQYAQMISNTLGKTDTIAPTPPLNVAAATTAARSTQAAATTAASTTQVQAAMNAPESIGTTIMGSIPAAALGTSPQMSESIDEFVTRVMVAMGVVTQT